MIDLGGVHGTQNASVKLDDLGLTAGHKYNFDLFYAKRHTVESNLKLQTSIIFDSPIGGSVINTGLKKVVCKNVGTGQSVAITLNNAKSWNCTVAGLVTKKGDVVTETLKGSVR